MPPPLILLHGFPMSPALWAGLADVALGVTDRVDVDLFARRGPFAVDTLADDVHSVIADAGQPCVVGGLSMGGYVALSLADRYPADLAGLILFDTKPTAENAAARAKRDDMAALVRNDGAAAVADAMGPALLSPWATADVRDRFRRMAVGIPADVLADALTALRDRPDRTAALGRITVPTLCVVGEHDAATPPAVVEQMRRQIATAVPLAVIPAAGHVPPLENPAATAEVVRRFLAEVARVRRL